MKNVELSDTVIATVTEKATLQVEGVCGFSARFYDEVVDGITERFGQKRTPGIAIKQSKKGVEITIYVIVELQKSLVELGKDIQNTVGAALSLMLDIHNYTINVNIVGIATPTPNPVPDAEESVTNEKK